MAHGAKFHIYHEVTGFIYNGKGRVSAVQVLDRASGLSKTIEADIFINATGAWAGKVSKLAGIDVDVRPTPGVMVAVDQRLTETVINRLTPPDDGDIVIPQRRMLVIGTTFFEIEDVDFIPLDPTQTQMMIDRGSAMIPRIREAKIRGVYMSSRPLIGAGAAGRSLTRTFKTYDHEEMDNIAGMVSVIGGKATTCRLMAEKVSDLICAKLGFQAECQTAEIPSPILPKIFQPASRMTL